MRFSYLLSVFLATLTIARPIAKPEAAEPSILSTRATDDSAEYTLAIRTHPGLKKGDWVWFTMEWPIGSIIGDGDTESKDEISQQRNKFDFDHIGIVIGQVIEVTFGKGKNMKTKRDFKASLYHMIEIEDITELKSANWRADPSKTLKFGGLTSSRKAAAAKKAATGYFDEDSHKKYAIDGNNCNDFVNAVKKAL